MFLTNGRRLDIPVLFSIQPNGTLSFNLILLWLPLVFLVQFLFITFSSVYTSIVPLITIQRCYSPSSQMSPRYKRSAPANHLFK